MSRRGLGAAQRLLLACPPAFSPRIGSHPPRSAPVHATRSAPVHATRSAPVHATLRFQFPSRVPCTAHGAPHLQLAAGCFRLRWASARSFRSVLSLRSPRSLISIRRFPSLLPDTVHPTRRAPTSALRCRPKSAPVHRAPRSAFRSRVCSCAPRSAHRSFSARRQLSVPKSAAARRPPCLRIADLRVQSQSRLRPRRDLGAPISAFRPTRGAPDEKAGVRRLRPFSLVAMT
jgi:hypothetical protein